MNRPVPCRFRSWRGVTDIFVSHSHQDRALVDALDAIHTAYFGERVHLVRSSDQSAGGGIPPGAEWLSWITEKITNTTKTYVLLTPNSVRKPWVLWESGAAAGVALATERQRPVVPITFGISDNDVPTPFRPTESVQGDGEGDGIVRLLDFLNTDDLGGLLTGEQFEGKRTHLAPYLAAVEQALEGAEPMGSLLATVPHLFSATRLAGHWATSYRFDSDGEPRCHADIAEVTADSDRRLTANNRRPEPVTDAGAEPFFNEIDAELVNRHVIGHWKNTSDTRYFGTIHLAVLSRDNVMEGYYTSFAEDDEVGTGTWKWVRIDPASLAGVDLSQAQLRAADVVNARLAAHGNRDGAIAATAILREG